MAGAAEVIKDRLSIVDVIGSYIKLENAGANLKAKCPFHNEKTPSFFVSPARGSYYCFGCGVKGDIFSFVQEYEKIDFLGALKILAERAGVELDQFKTESHQKLERQYKILDLATSFFQKKLTEIHREYLHSRGLSDESIASWRIGFAPDEWRSLMEYMLAQRIDGQQLTEQELVDTGLIKRGEPGENGREKIYDRFRSRIMFPLFDSSGRVIAFSGRIYGKEGDSNDASAQAKYLNSPDMKLFNKSEALYGFDRAKQSMRERGYAVLVEGQMDLLMTHQAGVTNAVATSGTSLTKDHLAKIARMTRNIIFMYDSDNAGYGATRRGERLAIEAGFDVKVASLPAGEDPASLIQKDKNAFINSLKHSTHVIEYYLAILLAKYTSQHDLLKAIEKELVPDIALTPSAIRRAELISLVSLKTKIPEKAISEEVEKEIKQQDVRIYEGKDRFVPAEKPGIGDEGEAREGGTGASDTSNISSRRSSSKSVDIALRRSIALLTYMQSGVKDGDLSQEKVDTAWTRIQDVLSPEDQQILINLKEHESEELLFEAEMLFGKIEKGDMVRLEHNLEELLLELEERSLKNTLSHLMSELQLAEKGQDKVKSDEIITKCQEISLKLSGLNKRRQSHFNARISSKP